MTIAATPDLERMELHDRPDWYTTGSWATEAASVAAFDALVSSLRLFRSHAEVVGTLTQPRPGQKDRSLRIDRVLVPTTGLIERGWKHGAIGVECKRSGENIGPPLSQAMDYVRGSWLINGIWFQLGAVFLWPMAPQGGPLASLMAHQRIGAVAPRRTDRIHFSLGEEVILADSPYGLRVAGLPRAGAKVGSR